MTGLYLELDQRSALDPGSRLAIGYQGRTKHVDYRGNTGRCGRCNRDLNVHAWRVIDLTDPELVAEQDGVLDCRILGDEQ